jgi:hypothetical protein
MVVVHRFLNRHIRVLNPRISAVELCSSLLLLVFFNSHARDSLGGEVNMVLRLQARVLLIGS